jgi:hypothetical protein
LGPIIKVSALDEGIGVICTHRRVVLHGRITRPEQDIGKAIWSAGGSRDRLDLMIKRTQVVAVGVSGVGDVKIKERRYARVNTVETVKR